MPGAGRGGNRGPVGKQLPVGDLAERLNDLQKDEAAWQHLMEM